MTFPPCFVLNKPFQDEYMIALFQLSSTEYELFYSIQPMDYVRYVSCDLTSVPISENPSPVRNLVKRLSEVRVLFSFNTVFRKHIRGPMRKNVTTILNPKW